MRRYGKIKKCFLLGVIATMLLAQGNVALAATGWVKRSGNWYYYNAKGVMTTGWQQVKGTWYYMNEKGIMQTGWLWDANNWYYLRANGDMAVGWVQDKGTWYYLTGSGAMKTGWLLDKGQWYYLTGSGAMKTGWLLDRGTWYYLNPNGDMATGFIVVDGKKYYLNADGSMMANTVALAEDKECVFDEDGVIISEKVVFQGEEEEKAIEYLKKKKSEQTYAEQALKETQELKQNARELARQYAESGGTGNPEQGILYYKSSNVSCQEAIDAWLEGVGMEYYNLMACNEVGFACYEKDGIYYWVCVTKDSRLPL